MTDRILFLDIDGVMINGAQIIIDRMSTFDRKFPTTTVAILNEICNRTSTKIVFNSSHNQHWQDVPDIEVALIAHGLDAAHIHPTDNRTRYPSIPRKDAIIDWLERHPEVEDQWMAVDDALCADSPHMVLVDPHGGLDVNHANQIIGFFHGQMINICF